MGISYILRGENNKIENSSIKIIQQTQLFSINSMNLLLNSIFILIMGMLSIQCTLIYIAGYSQSGKLVKAVSITSDFGTFWTQRNSRTNSKTMEFIAYQYNVTSGASIVNNITLLLNQTYDSVQQKLVFDNITSNKINCYILEGITGKVCCLTNNTNLTCTNWNYTNIYSNIQIVFGVTVNDLYMVSQSGPNFQLKKCTWFIANSSNLSCVGFIVYNGQNIVDVIFNNNLIYLLSYKGIYTSRSDLVAVVRILVENNGNLGLIKQLHYSFSTNSNLKFCMNQAFLVLSSGQQLSVTPTHKNFTPTTNHTLKSSIYDIACTIQNLYVSIDNCIRQYTFSQLYLAQQHSLTSVDINSTINIDQLHNMLILYRTEDVTISTSVNILQYTGGYVIYTPPFTCEEFYFSTSPGNCIFNSTMAASVNLSTLYYVTPLVTNNTLPPDAANQTQSFCRQHEGNFCAQFCAYQCQTCEKQTGKCLTCRQNYQFNQDGNCTLATQTKLISMANSILSTFRFQKAQQIYFFVDYLNFYNYHKTNYTGVFGNSISQINAVKDNLWNFFPIDEVNQWFHQPLPESISQFNYNAYTNQKFLSVERSDTFFLINLKSYFLIYLPLTLVSFFIINRIFQHIITLKISAYIRTYAFWLYIGVIVVVQNSESLFLYSYNALLNLMSFNYKLYYLQSLTVFSIGILFIINIAIFPMSYYIYGKMFKYFLSNCYNLSGSLTYTYVRFTILPIVESVIHCAMYSMPKDQLILLSVLKIIVIGILIFFLIWSNNQNNFYYHNHGNSHIYANADVMINAKDKIMLNNMQEYSGTSRNNKKYKNNLFINKILFWNEIIFHFMIIILNIMLYLGYHIPQLSQNYNQIIQPSMQIWTTLFLALYFFSIGYIPLKYIISRIVFKLRKSVKIQTLFTKINQTINQGNINRQIINDYKQSQETVKIIIEKELLSKIKKKANNPIKQKNNVLYAAKPILLHKISTDQNTKLAKLKKIDLSQISKNKN